MLLRWVFWRRDSDLPQSLFSKKVKKYARSLNKEEFENGTQVYTDFNQNLIQHSQVR